MSKNKYKVYNGEQFLGHFYGRTVDIAIDKAIAKNEYRLDKNFPITAFVTRTNIVAGMR